MQVHWLAKPGPAGDPPATLCDPAIARATVARAGRLGIPFRVALPTYGYRLVLDAHGRMLAGAGEGSALEAARPPPGGAVRTLMADPVELADLVRGWQTVRPAAMTGVIWYRLPVAEDRLNWTARTLTAVAAGHTPHPRLAVRFVRSAADGPWELRLCNDGDADASLPGSIAVHCVSPPIAADGVGGFALQPGGISQLDLIFAPRAGAGRSGRAVPAGASLGFGWVRLSADEQPPGRAPMAVAINAVDTNR